ncbi:SPOR domain-containing protein [Aquimarina brevivitae]|uniref:Sporulation related protein n=1 Tax=Aquimarina brevivitae TaxID=323412 RepID=A0A4Q7NY28_9FLAO|nr:SPOR domain-containing protein [Aquimarina brevivitae]RZS92164.1 hypothetical protein EV197_2799 [Aquimarina brevivitae]
MPYLSEEELDELNKKIENSEEKERITQFEHTKALREEKEKGEKFKIATIILGIVALLGVAGTVYFMNFSTPAGMISSKEHKKKVAKLEKKIEEQTQNINELNTALDANANNPVKSGSLNDKVVYAVQIGAFEDKDLSMYSDSFVNFKEIKSGGFNKYAVGNFETLEEAKRFRKEMVSLGFRNAFIASYQNGQRIKIEEAW